jgi:hypothetical protein
VAQGVYAYTDIYVYAYTDIYTYVKATYVYRHRRIVGGHSRKWGMQWSSSNVKTNKRNKYLGRPQQGVGHTVIIFKQRILRAVQQRKP